MTSWNYFVTALAGLVASSVIICLMMLIGDYLTYRDLQKRLKTERETKA